MAKGKNENDARYTFRIDRELLNRLRCLADYNGRSANKEIEMLIKRHVADFERENGKIEPEEKG